MTYIPKTNSNSYNIGAPTGSSTTFPTFAMMGFGITNGVTLTPMGTGIVKVVMDGTILHTVAGKGTWIVMRYGTGTAPSNGDTTAPGAIIGVPIRLSAEPTGGNQYPLYFCGIATGLTIGTAYWFDAAVASTIAPGGNNARLAQVTLNLMEL